MKFIYTILIIFLLSCCHGEVNHQPLKNISCLSPQTQISVTSKTGTHSRIGIHFNWLTLLAQNNFFDEKFLNKFNETKDKETEFPSLFKILKQANDHPLFQEMHVNIFEWLEKSKNEFDDLDIEGRAVISTIQGIFFYGVAKEFMSQKNFTPSAINFYSSGIYPALLFSDSVELNEMIPFMYEKSKYSLTEYKRIRNSPKNFQTYWIFNINPNSRIIQESNDLHANVTSLIQRLELDETYIVEYSGNQNLAITGPEVEINKLLSNLTQSLPSDRTKIYKEDFVVSAHSPLIKTSQHLKDMINTMTFKSPTYDIIGAQGQFVRAYGDPDALKKITLEGLFGHFLNTKVNFDTLRNHSEYIITFGAALNYVQKRAPDLNRISKLITDPKTDLTPFERIDHEGLQIGTALQNFKLNSMISQTPSLISVAQNLLDHFYREQIFPTLYQPRVNSNPILFFDQSALIISTLASLNLNERMTFKIGNLYFHLIDKNNILIPILNKISQASRIPFSEINPINTSQDPNGDAVFMLKYYPKDEDVEYYFLTPINSKMNLETLNDYIDKYFNFKFPSPSIIPFQDGHEDSKFITISDKAYVLLSSTEGERNSSQEMNTDLMRKMFKAMHQNLWSNRSIQSGTIDDYLTPLGTFNPHLTTSNTKKIKSEIKKLLANFRKGNRSRNYPKLPQSYLHGALYPIKIRWKPKTQELVAILYPSPRVGNRSLDIAHVSLKKGSAPKFLPYFNSNLFIKSMIVLNELGIAPSFDEFRQITLLIRAILLKNYVEFYDLIQISEQGRLLGDLNTLNGMFPYDNRQLMVEYQTYFPNESSSHSPILQSS